MRISVIGTGYLGAVHAACMSELGHEVLGVDSDSRKIHSLSNGQAPFYEPGLADMLIANVQAGRLHFSTSLLDAADYADVHFICVGTPQQQGSLHADLSSLYNVIDGLVPHLTRNSLLVGKSTVPVGTAPRLSALINQLAVPGIQVGLAWNPEFLREGFAIEDTLRPERLAVGTTSVEDDAILREVYAELIAAGTPYIRTDLATAELAKVAANAFLATKISFINAMANVCEAADADVVTLANVLGYDSRIGRRFLSAGLGFGGGCLGKDIRAFIGRASELGVADSVQFLEQVDAINMTRRQRAVDLAREIVGGTFIGCNVAVLGAAFKPETDDVRDSPALSVAEAIRTSGAAVRVHDPKAIDNARRSHPELEFADDIAKVCEAADVVLHLTEWQHYREVDPVALQQVVRVPRILDGRNILPYARWREAGWEVHTMGTSAFQYDRTSAELNKIASVR